MILTQEGQSAHVQGLFTDWLSGEEEVMVNCERYNYTMSASDRIEQ